VASMKTQVQIATDALQKMNTELGKLSDEEDLPTWWTNKVATAVSKLDGMADYIDAKSDQGEKMNEDNITEEKVFVVRFEKEGMRFAVPFRKASMAYDGKKILAKSAGVSNLSVTQDVLKPGVKFSAENFGKIVKESRMGEYFLDMQMDAQDMKERDFINKYKGEMGMNANELKRMYKEFNEEVVKEAVAQNDAFVVTGGPGDNAQKVIAVFKDKGNGLKDAKKARDDYDKKNNPTKQSHKARIYRQTRLSQSNNRLKPGEKIMYSTFGNKQQFTKLKEDIQVEEVVAKDLLEAGGKYLKYSDLLLQKGRLMQQGKNTAMIDKEISKEMKKLNIKEGSDEYEKFFQSALKKFKIDSPADLKTDDKKKEFFNYIDKNYKAKEEDLDKEDETSVKKVIKGLKKAVDAHSGQVKTLTKDIQDETDKNVDETLDKIREANIQKGKSMRNILADIWKMNEGKSPFEKEEGFSSDAQRRAAFASGYKEKGKKKKEEVEKSSKTATGQKPTKVEIEPEVK